MVDYVSDAQLKRTIKQLCTTKIRSGLTLNRVQSWLNQFHSEEEQRLSLLILRNLIYRSTHQLQSSLNQALKKAVLHYGSFYIPVTDILWREIISGKVTPPYLYYGPPPQASIIHGKSGQIITRLLTRTFSIPKSNISTLNDVTIPESDEYFFIVDDGMFTATQMDIALKNVIVDKGRALIDSGKVAIVVALVYEDAIATIQKLYPNILVFFGEKLTANEGFMAHSQDWISSKIWTFDLSPFEVYNQVHERANFSEKYDIGFGGAGLLVGYEHGIPDNSLQLLWGKSETWTPLIDR